MSEQIVDVVDGMMAEFRERIVRCRDCKFSPQKNTLGGKRRWLK